MMGLHLPGTAFVNPERAAARRAHRGRGRARLRDHRARPAVPPIGRTVDEKAIVNAMVGLAATGGSTNHAIHLVAIARAAGIAIDWDDLDELSRATPLLARVYPTAAPT